MKAKLFGLLIAVLLLSIVFSGCNEQKTTNNIESDSAKFIGTWKYPLMSGTSTLYWTFNNNGTIKEESFVLSNTSVNWDTYNIENNKICFKSQFIVHLPEGASTTCYSYQFSDDEQMLNLTDDNGVIRTLTRIEFFTVNLIVNFTYLPESNITTKTDIIFNGSFLMEPLGGYYNVLYKWDFGDGTLIDVENNSNLIHRYNASGNYIVNLTVEWEWNNLTGYREKTLVVED